MISVIILTYNSEKSIDACLDSIFGQEIKDTEVIVVDNGSTDGTLGLIKAQYPQVVLVENNKNLGPCHGRNQGIATAQGDWVITLDCDTILENNFFLEIFNITKKLAANIGMIQPKILMPDKKTIYSYGIHLCWSRRFYDIGYKRQEKDKVMHFDNVFGPCAACAVYRRDMLEDIKEATGYFDERFFFFVEDVDLAWRAQKKGWKAILAKEANCYHYGRGSAYEQALRQYLCFRNRYYTIKKNEGFAAYLCKVLPFLFYDLPRIIYLSITNEYMWKYKKYARINGTKD